MARWQNRAWGPPRAPSALPRLRNVSILHSPGLRVRCSPTQLVTPPIIMPLVPTKQVCLPISTQAIPRHILHKVHIIPSLKLSEHTRNALSVHYSTRSTTSAFPYDRDEIPKA